MRKQDAQNLAIWLSERTEPVGGHWHSAAELYADYVSWANALSLYVVAVRSFSTSLQTLPNLTKRLHSRTRRSGFVGGRLKA